MLTFQDRIKILLSNGHKWTPLHRYSSTFHIGGIIRPRNLQMLLGQYAPPPWEIMGATHGVKNLVKTHIYTWKQNMERSEVHRYERNMF